MARNDNQWFKFYFRDWLESERLRMMPLDAQGLYLRMLAYQAIYGNVPTQIEDAELALAVRGITQSAWDAALQHFEVEDTETGARLYNTRLRSLLVVKKKKSETLSANRKNKRKSIDSELIKKEKRKAPIRASLSNSISSSVSKDNNSTLAAAFEEFWNAYPRKRDKKVAEATWKKKVTSPELAKRIVDHVRDRATKDCEWLKDGGDFIPYPSTFLNNDRWEDYYTPQRITQKPTFNRRPSTEGERRNAEMLHEGDVSSRQLTLEEQEATAREAEEFETAWRKENGLE